MAILGVSSDLIEQFKEGKNTLAICKALDRQIEELVEVFNGIATLTNLDAAEGEQLDMIGDILCLTRAEAALLCGDKIYFDVLEDEPYRRYLKYKAIANASNCTYSELIGSLKAILGDSVSVIYSEDPEYPATIILDIAADEEGAIYLEAIPPIKSAGVAVRYSTSYLNTIEISNDMDVYRTGIACGTHNCGTYPKSKQ